jgi:hypothetical protein
MVVSTSILISTLTFCSDSRAIEPQLQAQSELNPLFRGSPYCCIAVRRQAAQATSNGRFRTLYKWSGLTLTFARLDKDRDSRAIEPQLELNNEPGASIVVSNQAETKPQAQSGSNGRLGVHNSRPGRSPTLLHKTISQARQIAHQLFSTKATSTDRVPEVHGGPRSPRCAVGPYGLPNRPPIYSQRSAPCLLFVMVKPSFDFVGAYSSGYVWLHG